MFRASRTPSRKRWPTARSRPCAASFPDGYGATAASHEQRRRAARPRCADARAPKRPLGFALVLGDAFQIEKERAIGKIGPSDNVLDPVQDDRAHGIEQRLVLVGV